ncbi:hypothetical protein BDZ97DRAFT_1227138 [Flammula alnicola]|nr:hypothetical protein BDZ97DRAFT_1227138 [Flammula alnicola]
MRRFSSYLSRGLRNLAKARFRFSSAHPNFRGEFFFAGDHDKAESQPITKKYFFRPSSRTGTVSATITTEYSLQPDAEFPNPFADYLADDAKVWTMYLNLTKNKGEELMRMWNSDLDTILIFAGLFSAILTAFLIETRKSLQPDSQVTANLLLEQVIQQLRNPGSPYNSSVTLQNNFNPPNPLLWVNGLWFVSLTFSLAGAFGAILAKGWVSQFIPTSAGLPIDDACNRHRRFFGDDQRHLRAIITTIPITLHIGFFLFFAGLIVLLFQDDVRIGIVVTVFISITIILYLGCSMRPVLNPNSPFRTPISGLLPVC